MLTFRNLALRRGEQLLLSDVDLIAPRGLSAWAWSGRNGCGKSSLFAVVQGDLDPDRGDLELLGPGAHRQRGPGNALTCRIPPSTS